MRFDKPAGIALLWAPTAWALWLANQGHPAPWLWGCFLLGTICMRAAGCVINDLVDKNIDKHVQRTRARPITSGEVGEAEAYRVVILLLMIAGLIVVQLPLLCWIEALFALFITMLYPFAKRVFQAPQLILGIAFSMGIPMAYTASGLSLNKGMAVLVLLNFFWIVAYDTMYALVDRSDDLKIGVKSTAILFGDHAVPIILSLLILTHGLWLFLSIYYLSAMSFWISWVAGLGILCYQARLLRSQKTADAMRAFLFSSAYGLVMWFGMFNRF